MKIEAFPALAGLNATQVANFVSACTEARFERGSVIIRQGERGDALYFVLEGRARVFLNNGEPTDLAEIGPPAVIGEMEILTDQPRTASVEAVTNVRAMSMPFEILRDRIKDGDPATLKVMFAVARVLAHRLAAMDHKLESLVEGKTMRKEELQDFKRKLFTDWTF